MLSDNKIKELIKNNELLPEAELNAAATEAEEKGVRLEKLLLDKAVISEDILYNAVAGEHRLPFVNLKEKTIDKEVLFLIPEPIAASYEIIAFDKSDKGLSIALTDPDDIQTIEFIKRKTDLPLIIHVATPSAIHKTVNQYHQNLESELSSFQAKVSGKLSAEIPKDEQAALTEEKLTEAAKDVPVVRVVDTLLEYAIFEGASDIHVEPGEKQFTVRYRVDGILRDVMTLPGELLPGLVARIKILSNLKLDEHRLPQDGRFKIENRDYKISFRVSVLPVLDGEKIVMRLLDESKKILSLEQLGLVGTEAQIVKQNLARPNGIILVTGPTGSGKTTTLYTMMQMLNTPNVNISTVEDPIEYRMPRINQSQVNPKIGFTFAAGLRALLRQDPNIIMVGEIRDKETAGIAINAAMTGHLVLSTLHTNDAPTALPRLLDMDIEPFLLSSTANLIMAQRLVRKICQSCRASYTLKPAEVEHLEKDYGLNLTELSQKMARAEKAAKGDKDFGNILFFKAKGCNRCAGRGYKGRIGIYECLEVSEKIKEMIVAHATSDDIRREARNEGMLTMLEDGFLKAKSGITTIEEILRVTKE